MFPLPERRALPSGSWHRPDQLRLLLGRRLQRRRRDQRQRRLHPGPSQSVANIIDGTSQTAAASEQSLGIAGPYSQTTPTPVPVPWKRAMARVVPAHSPTPPAPPPATAGCSTRGRLVGRQLPERALQPLPDPERQPSRLHRLSQPRLEGRAELAPRRRESALLRGHVAFVKDTINLATWRAISTRAGGEAISADAL